MHLGTLIGRIPPDERSNAATAAIGLLAAAMGAGVVAAASAGHDGWRVASALVFASSLVLLHLASTLYHMAPDGVPKRRFKLFDHCAIYLLIAGTYTPFTLIGLRGALGWQLFATIWSLAALGIGFKLVSLRSRHAARLKLLSTLTYVAMGWLVLAAIKPVYAMLDAWTFGWLMAGGVAYTLGTVFYHRPGFAHAHAVWHLFVIAGGACHVVAVLAQLSSSA